MQEWLSWSIPIAITLAVYIVGFIIFLENRSPNRTFFWLLILAFFPVFGLIFYIFFGRSSSRYKFFSKMSHVDIPALQEKMKTTQASLSQLKEQIQEKQRLPSIISAVSFSYVTFNNNCRILNNGEEKFNAIFDAIKRARHHIHLEYFIVKNDNIGNKLKELLIAKAGEGVEVRFLYDSLGSRNLGKKYLQELRSANIKTAAFLPFTIPVPNTWLNYRNHRKILIVDGKEGYLGGLNIGDEYLDGGKRFSFWRDTHLEIKGDALDILQGIFISDWEFTTKEKISDEKLFPEKEAVGNHAMQIAASGPDGNWEAIHIAYFTAIAAAKNNIYITTPYLIPDDSIATALKSAAMGGVDVKIVFPGTPDHRFVYWASYSYFEELLKAGVEIYLYQKGFVHAKTLAVDSQVAVIGTANMDMRSFYYSFEINAFVYSQQIALELENSFMQDIKHSRPVTLEELSGRPLYQRAKESGARLLSPLL